MKDTMLCSGSLPGFIRRMDRPKWSPHTSSNRFSFGGWKSGKNCDHTLVLQVQSEIHNLCAKGSERRTTEAHYANWVTILDNRGYILSRWCFSVATDVEKCWRKIRSMHMRLVVGTALQWAVSIAPYHFGAVSWIETVVLSVSFRWLYFFRTLDLWR